MQSIIIADSHTLCREALSDYIRHTDNGYVIEGFADYTSLAEHMKDAQPDLLLIDTDLPGLDTSTVGRDFIKEQSKYKIGMIVSSPYDEEVFAPYIKGAFPKSLSCKAFMNGINDVLAGQRFFPPMTAPLFDEISLLRSGPQDFNLTTREKEVLTHLVKGASNKDIARALDLQVVTIKLHVRGICRKMKAANRTQAALMAKENGWG